MPGFAATLVDSGAVKSGLSCPHCRLILREPVQTDEGLRLCRSCFDEIAKMPGCRCEECNSFVVPDQFYPDRAVQRELSRLKVFCQFKSLGCDWEGALKDWESHSGSCTFKGVNCPFAGCCELLLASQLEQHKLECNFRNVKCQHCDLQLQFHQLEKHHQECSKYPVRCDRQGCGAEIAREQLSKHLLDDCAVEDCMLCSKQVLRESGAVLGENDIHLSSPLENFKHHQILARHQSELQTGLVELKSICAKDMEKLSKVQDDLKQLENETKEVLRNKVQDLQSQLDAVKKRLGRGGEAQNVDNGLTVRLKVLEDQEAKNNQIIKNQRKEISDLKAELQAFRREYNLHMQQRGSNIGHAPRHTVALGRDNQSTEREATESRVLQVEKRLEEVARQANRSQIQVQEIELQLQASLASTYNGGFLWRIPDIARRRRDAVEERVVSLYSPPFYTARNGYKMCIRVYLNGDGMGYKTHLSLFFVLMKGEFDALLKWPFEHKISMILVDQDHRKHIVQTFKPTLESSSFQRPRSDMNVASGCPQFAKLSVLDEDNYVRDDVMFVKCIVDTSKIFHP